METLQTAIRVQHMELGVNKKHLHCKTVVMTWDCQSSKVLRKIVEGDNKRHEQEIPSSPGIRGCLRTARGQTSVSTVTLRDRNNRSLSGLLLKVGMWLRNSTQAYLSAYLHFLEMTRIVRFYSVMSKSNQVYYDPSPIL